MPEISIIIPIYNAQQYLNQSVHSVLNQSFTDFELLLVNDGSTDYSMLFCRAFAEKDKRIRILDLPHGGEATARAAGVCAASGKYTSFIDADDWVEKDFLKHLYTAITESNADISMCRVTLAAANINAQVPYTFESGVYSQDALEELKKSRLLCGSNRKNYFSFGYLWDKLYRTELLRNNLPYMDRRVVVGPDTLLSTACFLDSKCFSFHSYYDHHYRQREGSVVRSQTTRNLEEKLNELVIFRAGLLKIMEEKGYSNLNYKVDTDNIYRLWGLFQPYKKEELQSLPRELKQLIQSQSEKDGCDRWAEVVRFVKSYVE